MTWVIDNIFDLVMEQNASDIVFVSGALPTIWVAGQMRRIDAAKLNSDAIAETFFPLLSDSQRDRLEEIGDLDFSIGRGGVGRLRINLHRQRGSWSAAMRFNA